MTSTKRIEVGSAFLFADSLMFHFSFGTASTHLDEHANVEANYCPVDCLESYDEHYCQP